MTARRFFPLALILLLAWPGFSIAGSSVSGTWTLEQSPILLQDDVFVPEGSTLEVQAGVRVLLPEGGKFSVFGELICLGTDKDPVVFEPTDGLSAWVGVEIFGNDEGLASWMRYTHIKNAIVGLSLNGGVLTMEHCQINAIDAGARLVEGSQGNFTDCNFAVLADQSNAYGIFARESHVDLLDSRVRLQIIQENGANPGSAIYMYHVTGSVDSSDVSVSSASGANGISLLACDSDVTVQRSSVHVVRTGSNPNQPSSAVELVDSDLTLDRMSIHLQAIQGSIYGVSTTLNADAIIRNTIIAAPETNQNNNLFAVYIDSFDPSSSVDLAYSCFSRMQLVNTGSNFSFDGDSVFEANPGWVNPSEEDYHLEDDSPCIDAGDPNGDRDPDGSIVDLGRHHWTGLSVDDPVTASRPETMVLAPAYPNPFNAGTRVSISLPTAGNLTVLVVDALGRRTATLAQGHHTAGTHDLSWQPANQGVASGVYLVQARMGTQMQVQRMVYLK